MTTNQAIISSVPSFDDLPRRVDRRTAAKLITHYFFEVSPRTLEAWPIKWVHVNGKAIGETKDFFHVAELKLNAATPMRGGRRSPLLRATSPGKAPRYSSRSSSNVTKRD